MSGFVGMTRFELATPWSQTRCANRTALHPYFFGALTPARAGRYIPIFPRWR